MLAKSICLIGYMGSGKTTVGRSLAEQLQLPFYDLDHYIESKTGKTITVLFQQYGDFFFRKKERKYLLELLEKPSSIIALGGGTPCYYDNISYILQSSRCIYLGLSPKDLVDRLKNNSNDRPLIKDKSEQELLEFITLQLKEREQYYNRAMLKIQNINQEATFSKILESIV